MYKTYNRIYTKPDTGKMKLIQTDAAGSKPTSPKAYYDRKTSTLLIQYTYIRIRLSGNKTCYELWEHYEYMKRSISIENPSDARLTELALLAIKEDLGGSGLKGLTFDYYDYTTNSVVPNPWIKLCSSKDAGNIAEQLFYLLDLEIEQKLCSQPGYAYIPRLLKQKLPNGKTLGFYGIWKHTRKPLDREGLTGIAYIPKAKNI